ncbi:hypothetical protein K1T71_002539 [Dendrolimus kikuchii]|uniref:Uncharacterized protein n=1 Tax=Dendrolimus kikuchii TaxID=765133 RepID=A0ACC1DD52_9NEOP|nr:hypothetical protein K1T71_002539 [Dendrolimus kikuchii]
MATNYFKLQENILGQIVKSKSNFKKTPKERLNLCYVETRLDNLEQHWTDFTSNDQRIVMEFKKEELEVSSYVLNDIYNSAEEYYIEYKALLKDQLRKLNPESVSDKCSTGQQQLSVKLPKIEIPKFSGKYAEWASFRDLFTSLIHKNGNIDNVQKLHYLKSSVTGEAEQLLRHIPVTSDNYLICWSQLESRYNNKKFLANCILKKLINQKVLTTESSTSVKQLLDTTKECLCGLQNLGVDISSWDIIVIFLVSQKLDPESRKLWEQKVTESAQELPSLTMFEDYLENRYRSIEFLDPKVQKQDKPNCNHVTTTTVINCSFCSDGHKLANCKKFARETTDVRRAFVQSNHLCFNCLNADHTVFQCNMSTRCRLCKKKHHTLLHPKTPKSVIDHIKTDQSVNKSVVATATTSTSQTQSESTGTSTITSYFSNTPSQVLLATALVKAESPTKNMTIVLRSLLDQGSQASFVTESAVQLLGLKRIPETSTISGLGGDRDSTIASKFTVVLNLQSRIDSTFKLSVKAHVLKKLTCFLPSRQVRVLPQFASLELADPSFGTPNKIDLLLGAEVYSQILLEGLVKGLPGSVIAQNTRLGWILSGKTDTSNCLNDVNQSVKCNVISMHIVDATNNDLLKKFWEMESEPSSYKAKHLTPEEQSCETLFSQSTCRDKSGRYIVKLPFKSQDPLCKYGNSKEIARKRFFMLEKRLFRNPELKREYSKVMNEYVHLGHMEVVSNPDKSDAVYLPHHAVVKQDKITSRVRVVFDASCSGSNGVSLNNDLMTGPTLQPELRHLVMRWRRFPIALVADIVKMYRQVKVSESDIDFQRIYWREDPDQDLQQFRLLRVTFGTSPAPFLAVRCLQQLACDEGADFPLAAQRVLCDFYMDDLISGTHSVDQGVLIHKQMIGLLKRGCFPLQKWSSNNADLMSHISKGNNIPEDLELKTDEVMRILGLTWNREGDTFYCTVKLPPLEIPVTKRRVVSDIARLFDPLGWLAPSITTAKVFIQRLWLSGIEWDSELPSYLLEDWISFRDDLPKLAEIHIPRWMSSSEDDRCIELHGFADASNVAYAAVVYARVVDKHGHVHVSLVTSKTRVAPIKQVSIPRLELCGAVLLAKLLHEVSEVLEVPKHHVYAWTDSSIVLAWLRCHPSRWKTFIANRVSEILTLLDSNQWSHVSSKDNPADCASRGLQPSELIGYDLWNRGPEWLHLEEIDYKKGDILHTNLEERKTKTKSHHTTCSSEGDPFLERFSSLRRLVRVLAWCRRLYLPGLQKPSWLLAKELGDVLNACIKRCQNQYFDTDLAKNNKLSSLNPFRDNNGIWRVGGRLQHASLSEDRKHPILIPRQSHIAKLIIANAHEKTLHGGPQLTINYIHSKYWIVNLRNLVKSYIHKCVTCIRYSSTTVHPLMGQLPTARATTSRPFLQSGLDYAGPIAVRTTKGRGHKATKGYICLFICMATRAIHLEVVSDLTSDAFLAAFKRFVARRGHCNELWSDNATTFVGADRELKTLLESERSTVATDIADWLSTNGTTWHRIPPYSPNFGGLWEAGVKSTKGHLKKVVGDTTLTFEELTTVLAQIEACLNSRPIARSGTDSDDAYPLTPGHFLVGEPLVLIPDANYEYANITSLKRWQLTQRMVQEFWRRWSREYLTQFLQRNKWKERTSEPEIGDIVLVKEDNLPPARWLYGIITDKHSGLDNVTRVVSLRCKDTIIKRPVSKIVKLPVT